MPKISLQKGAELISIVQKYPALYDPAHREYGVSVVRDQLWCEVAAKCGLKTGYKARKMYENLQDCYQMCRDKLSANNRAKMWKFYRLMDFLEPFIDRRPRRSMANQNGPRCSLIPQTTESIAFWNNPENGQMQICEIYPENIPGDSADVNQTRSRFMEDNGGRNAPSASAQASNSLRKFFDAMFAATCELPVAEQRNVKREIMDIIAKEETALEEANDVRVKVERES